MEDVLLYGLFCGLLSECFIRSVVLSLRGALLTLPTQIYQLLIILKTRFLYPCFPIFLPLWSVYRTDRLDTGTVLLGHSGDLSLVFMLRRR